MFIKKGDGKGVCRLVQASRQRNKKIHMTLLEVNLKQSGGEPCIYNNTDRQLILLVAIYVDDILLLSNNRVYKEKLKENLTEKFKRKNFGEATQCLELCIHRNKEKHTIIVDQQQHKKALLEKLKTGQEKPEVTPMDPNQKMTRPQHRAAEENMLHQPHQC